MATVIAPERLYSFDEYIEQEINSELRLEYRRGRIVSVTGAKENHIEIVWNIGGLLRLFLKDKPFRGFGCDMRIECTPNEYYAHPDLSVAPSPPDIKPIRGTATLTNPVVIIEVLSPSTEAIDRGEKFVEYTKIASLREYFLVSQNVAQIERWSRGSDGVFIPTVVTGLKAELRLDSIDCALPMSEIYYQTTVQDEIEDPSP